MIAQDYNEVGKTTNKKPIRKNRFQKVKILSENINRLNREIGGDF